MTAPIQETTARALRRGDPVILPCVGLHGRRAGKLALDALRPTRCWKKLDLRRSARCQGAPSVSLVFPEAMFAPVPEFGVDAELRCVVLKKVLANNGNTQSLACPFELGP